MKSSTKKIESNIYVETRGQAIRFIVAVYPIPKDSATFSDRAEGLLWAQRRRVEFLEQKAGVRDAKSPLAAVFQPGTPPNIVGSQSTFDPAAISMSVILEHFREHELGKLGGKGPESSRLKRLQEWFGGYRLGQLNSPVVSAWQAKRRSGLLGSGRNPNRFKLTQSEQDTERKLEGAGALPESTSPCILKLPY